VSRYVGAAEAARQLGVRPATLYAYVSRGLISRRVAVDGRTSLYAVDDLERLASRSRRREREPRPSLDVQIATAVTTLDEEGPRYRGHGVARLARMCTFEQVAELLWSGDVPTRRAATWDPPAAGDVRRVQRATSAAPGPVAALIAAANVLDDGTAPASPGGARVLARRLLGLVPTALGERDPVEGSLAERLAQRWSAERADDLAPMLDTALVLLADHELATSTLAVRLAASVRASPAAAVVAGLATILGPLHGGASTAVVALLRDAAEHGAGPAVDRYLAAGRRLPGFGHKIYVGDDPRLAPLLEAIGSIPAPVGSADFVRDVIAVASARVVQRPNVDLGLGAVMFVGGLPDDAPIFAVARIAGFAAHYAEELAERPVRYRGIARPDQERTAWAQSVPEPEALPR